MDCSEESLAMPLCEQCQEKDASVFLTQVIFGKASKMMLCEACAEAKGLPMEVDASGLPMATVEQVLREMGMDPAALMQQAQAEILDLPDDAPTEVTLPDSVRVQELADALHAQVHQVIFVLIQHGKFTKPEDVIDFETASLVCEQFAVTVHRD